MFNHKLRPALLILAGLVLIGSDLAGLSSMAESAGKVFRRGDATAAIGAGRILSQTFGTLARRGAERLALGASRALAKGTVELAAWSRGPVCPQSRRTILVCKVIGADGRVRAAPVAVIQARPS